MYWTLVFVWTLNGLDFAKIPIIPRPNILTFSTALPLELLMADAQAIKKSPQIELLVPQLKLREDMRDYHSMLQNFVLSCMSREFW